MQQLIQPDTFSQMTKSRYFLYQIKSIFDTHTSRQWNTVPEKMQIS